MLVAAALAVAVAVVVEIALPGNALYHAGWYNVLLVALAVVTFVAGRRQFRGARSVPARVAIVTVIAGTAVTGLAGVASGLLGPENQSYVGAPGQRLVVESLGMLVFPLSSTDASASGRVTLERPLHASIAIDERPRYAGSYVVHAIPRSVVYVEARDVAGNRLTVTQPTGSAFLSPVLLMQHHQTIAGLDLPYDSFNVPAARRVVKAVMFTAGQAAMLLHGGAQAGEPAVLFAVDDEHDRPLPHAIALSAAGRAVRVGGLVLQATVASYPAVEVISAPNILATALGALLVLGGLAALISPLT